MPSKISFGAVVAAIFIVGAAMAPSANAAPRPSYNDLAGRNGSGVCWDLTMPRDNLVG
jgi:hypothetical protein